MDPITKKHWSMTQLGMWARCGMQYKFRYMDGLKRPPTIPLLKGSHFHRAAEHNHRQKIGSGKDLAKKDLQDFAATGFEDEIKEQGVFLLPDEAMMKASIINQGIKGLLSIVGLYRDKLAPEIQPVMVEQQIEVTLPEINDVIVGVLDLVEGGDVVREMKTSARKKAKDDYIKSVQLRFYSQGYFLATGRWPTVKVDLFVDTQTPTWTPYRDFAWTEAQYGAWLGKITSWVRAIEAGIFPAAGEDAWCCSPKWCGYWDICPYADR